jgi:hypothetical protein
MAFSASKLNNIAGSMGLSNVWIYTDTDTAIATIKAANYFANAGEYNMRDNDIIFLVGSDAMGLGYVTTLTATTSVITTVTAL